MYLKKCIYVNWGNIPNCEFEFGPVNLLSGGNGSGKTTAADAIQTIMTAAHDNLFHFNPGQDESSQRGRGGKLVRTLASYVLGCDDGAYARPEGCDGYLAGIFYPTPGESSEPFTALIGMRAFLDSSGQGAQTVKNARLDDLDFYILPDVSLSLSDLLKAENTHKYIVSLDRIHLHLKQNYGAENVEKYDKKKSYLCRLYGALRGKEDAVSEREAMNAARAFSRFMAYKPIKGIDEFVANEILEYRDLGEAIKTVSSMLKRIHGMEADAKKIRSGLDRLNTARDTADTYLHQWLDLQVNEYALVKGSFKESQLGYLEAKHKQQALREHNLANQQAIEASERRRDELQSLIVNATARRLGVPELRARDQLESELTLHKKQLTDTIPLLKRQYQQAEINQEAVKQLLSAIKSTSLSLAIPHLTGKNFLLSAEKLAHGKALPPLGEILNQDWLDPSFKSSFNDALELQELQNTFYSQLFALDENSQTGLRDELANERERRKHHLDRLSKAMEQKRKDVQVLESKQISYPTFVRQALDLLDEQLPKADARVLCDYVEVTDAKWQSAIEGYIGAARFGIMVDAQYEADAISLLRKVSNQAARARIIQGQKATSDLSRSHIITANAITGLMHFSHATAQAYLESSYGNVVCVESPEALKSTRRGVTAEGLGSGNYAMFRCDMPETDLVFGQGARQRALVAKREEFHELVTEWQEAGKYLQELSQLIVQIDHLKPLTYAECLKVMEAAQNKIVYIEQELSQITLSSTSELDNVLEKLKIDLSIEINNFNTLQQKRAEAIADIKLSDAQCNKLSHEQELRLNKLEVAETNIQQISSIWPDFDANTCLSRLDESISVEELLTLQNTEKTLIQEIKSALFKLQTAVLSHNQYCSAVDTIAFDLSLRDELSHETFKEVVQLRRQLDSLFNRDKNHILAARHQEIASMRASFNNAFVTNLCHSIYQSINDGKRVLEELNKELEHHRFGADKERFRFDWEWIPEYKEYWQFFKAVIDSPKLEQGENLFTVELDDKKRRIRDKLMSMLLDEDEQKALRELSRISDYRNYRRYEIYKEPEGKPPIPLSQYGTGSGGQLETPAYIIRSAAITSAFHFNEGLSHLRMVLVDEAFSKMDEHRSREVIHYLTESLGLQLMFIMPSSKSGPFMDIISNQFIFTKCPTTEPVGELRTRVLLDRQVCNQAKVAELMAKHRRTIRQQASLDFMVEVEH